MEGTERGNNVGNEKKEERTKRKVKNIGKEEGIKE